MLMMVVVLVVLVVLVMMDDHKFRRWIAIVCNRRLKRMYNNIESLSSVVLKAKISIPNQ